MLKYSVMGNTSLHIGSWISYFWCLPCSISLLFSSETIIFIADRLSECTRYFPDALETIKDMTGCNTAFLLQDSALSSGRDELSLLLNKSLANNWNPMACDDSLIDPFVSSINL